MASRGIAAWQSIGDVNSISAAEKAMLYRKHARKSSIAGAAKMTSCSGIVA